ncbi:MAG: hypothetical protein QNI84_11455 [Henriciella sp.]|nr:hypothetical protein [Henriciella sp.]
MYKPYQFSGALAAALMCLIPASASAQANDDVRIDLTVNVAPFIVVDPVADVSFAADGTSVTPSAANLDFCFTSSLPDVRLTLEWENEQPDGRPRLLNKTINDYINYTVAGVVSGNGGTRGFSDTGNTEDYMLAGAELGAGSCSEDQYRFYVNLFPATGTSIARRVEDVILENGLDDGRDHVFSDIMTVTFEPAP